MTVESQGRAVVVGVEATKSGRQAVEWAADQAARKGLPLRLVRALDWPAGVPRPQQAGDIEPPSRHREGARTHTTEWRVQPYWDADLLPPARSWADRFRDASVAALGESRALVARRQPDVDLGSELIDATPVDALRAEAADAAMIVLGSRHLSSTAEVFTSGGIAVPVAAHATCPVAVVRGPEATGSGRATLVVGVDGSPRAELALAYAFEEASRRTAVLQAVVATRPVGFASVEDADQDARRMLAENLAGWQEKYPEVVVRPQVAHGHAVQALVDASRGTLGLVVGTRGLGGFTGMLLGSVSQGVLHHAECPVVIVPSP
ncbi:universal stress protein [Yinghuangia sp. YIM S09857]|uniref:universal stress protein n=1 Tax=Yinghuangia sp. YIM S09857 TaxID=3436929 RepID=UPI003F533F9D